MATTTVRTLLLALVVGAGLAAPAAAADDPLPAEVRLPGPVHQGSDGTFTGTLRVRCAVGHEVQGVHLTFVQAGAAPSTQEPEALPACTGEWEPVAYASGEGYRAARTATVGVEVTVSDGSGGSAVVASSRDLYVRPAAKVRFPDKVTLFGSGEVRARVWVRCDAPWANFATFIGIAQDGTGLEPRVVEDVVCDGTFQRRTARLGPDEGAVETGWARLTVDVILEDQEDFGPEITSTRRVWVRRG